MSEEIHLLCLSFASWNKSSLLWTPMARVQWWKAAVTIMMLWKEIRQGNCLKSPTPFLTLIKLFFGSSQKVFIFSLVFHCYFSRMSDVGFSPRFLLRISLQINHVWLGSLETTGILHHPQISIHKYFLSDLSSTVVDKCSSCWKWGMYTHVSPGSSLSPAASSPSMSKIP